MGKRNKIMIVLVVVCILMAGVFVFRGTRHSSSDASEEVGSEASVRVFDHSDKNGIETKEKSVSGQAGDETLGGGTENKSKYEIAANPELTFDLSYIEDFISKGKQFILRRQIRVVAGDATSVKCLEYQISDPVDMRMEFFMLLDTGEVLKGYYSYYTAETSVECSDLTEEDVYRMREEEKQTLEKERQERERLEKAQERKESGEQESEQEQTKVQESEA